MLAAGGPTSAVGVDDEGEFGLGSILGVVEVEVELFFADRLVDKVELIFAFVGEVGLFALGEFFEGEGVVFVVVEAGEEAPSFPGFGFFEEAVFVGVAAVEDSLGVGEVVVVLGFFGLRGEGEEGEEDCGELHWIANREALQADLVKS